MEVREGRGYARILEQPRLDNNYTLSVQVEDRQDGSSRYTLAFYWHSGPAFVNRPIEKRGEKVVWSGRVEGESIVECRRDKCEARATDGGVVGRGNFRFTRPLPARDVTVSLDKTDGRGEIRLLEQPSQANGYAASVHIRDHQGGAGNYSFTLVWASPSPYDSDGAAAPGMIWSGRVDGRVRVTVEGGQARSEITSGGPIQEERAQFSRPLPPHEAPFATVRRLRGRGRVEILEYPSSRNAHRLVFEIADDKSGSDGYEVEVGW
jgi:hypothetical protein